MGLETQTKFPSTSSQDSSGDDAWDNIGNIFAQDGSITKSDLGKAATSHFLSINSFQFNIPLNATIMGIQLEFYERAEQASSNSYIWDTNIYLRDTSGNNKGSNYARSELVPPNYTWISYGGDNDLWGTSWTPNDINNTNFGSRVTFYNDASGSGSLAMQIDVGKITVTYNVPDETKPLLVLGAF